MCGERRRRSGFTMLELAVAMAMTGIIAVAAIGTYASLSHTLVRARSREALTIRSQRTVSYLVEELQSAGGGSLPARGAVALTALPDSDELHYLQVIPALPTVTATSGGGSSIVDPALTTTAGVGHHIAIAGDGGVGVFLVTAIDTGAGRATLAVPTPDWPDNVPLASVLGGAGTFVRWKTLRRTASNSLELDFHGDPPNNATGNVVELFTDVHELDVAWLVPDAAGRLVPTPVASTPFDVRGVGLTVVLGAPLRNPVGPAVVTSPTGRTFTSPNQILAVQATRVMLRNP